ncbi:phosphotransferase [Actinoplanes sp. TBRC 11911]|uniref:phosphotransferase n=1 Tax=Actinoplanes sp. TBRC 11911 TaxID=2729386 RepID=UPI00145FC40C|nr:phosphotransferase [Actinoplanes sp. TBRC 11911]NMO52744.1 phosphotransferase [Actinoplanes sp. TBRC 11911]
MRVLKTMHGSKRSLVRRMGDHTRTLILKEYLHGREGWVRESAALSVLPPGAPAPRLLAARSEPPAVEISDAGDGGSVADALLGDDPERAAAAVVAWAEAVATLHRVTAGSFGAFRDALAARAGGVPVGAWYDVRESVRELERHCAELGVAAPDAAMDELVALDTRLRDTGPNALSPGDTCPDNNVFTPDGGLVLIDFEAAEWRPVVWDVAYLRVPWPTCWCAWRLPAAVTEAAVEAYGNAVGFDRVLAPEIAAASAAWALLSGAWLLPRALRDEPLLKQGPGRRAMIQHRLRLAAAAEELPAMAELAGRLGRVLTGRWGECPVPYAPAFRSGR